DVSITVSPIYDSKGTVIGASTIARDITARKRRARRMEHRALQHPLTSLANRAVAIEQLHQALARSARHSNRVAVLFIDLDQFSGSTIATTTSSVTTSCGSLRTGSGTPYASKTSLRGSVATNSLSCAATCTAM